MTRKLHLDKQQQMWVVGAAAFLGLLLMALIILWVQVGAQNTRIKNAQAALAEQNRELQANEANLQSYSSQEWLASYAYAHGYSLPGQSVFEVPLGGPVNGTGVITVPSHKLTGGAIATIVVIAVIAAGGAAFVVYMRTKKVKSKR